MEEILHQLIGIQGFLHPRWSPDFFHQQYPRLFNKKLPQKVGPWGGKLTQQNLQRLVIGRIWGQLFCLKRGPLIRLEESLHHPTSQPPNLPEPESDPSLIDNHSTLDWMWNCRNVSNERGVWRNKHNFPLKGIKGYNDQKYKITASWLLYQGVIPISSTTQLYQEYSAMENYQDQENQDLAPKGLIGAIQRGRLN